jgi:hypothetical protein
VDSGVATGACELGAGAGAEVGAGAVVLDGRVGGETVTLRLAVKLDIAPWTLPPEPQPAARQPLTSSASARSSPRVGRFIVPPGARQVGS